MGNWRLLSGIAAVLVAMLAVAPTTFAADLTLDPWSVPDPISQLWARTDGSMTGNQQRGWLWGPTMLSTGWEPYREAPGGARQVFYFDKGRLEITDPSADPNAAWYVTAGLIVREMLSGQIQIGDNTFVPTHAATLPVTGDLADNDRSPSYATLGRLASVGGNIEANRHDGRVGQPVTALLSADGTVSEAAMPESGVVIGAYDAALGHNVPAIFQSWIDAQSMTSEYVVGRPLTEPYWVDTVVDGQARRVLVQAFERRVLTYSPDNAPGWQVEFGNAGIHYRLWRGMAVPDDQNLVPLASGVPLGEIIVNNAVADGVDPYLLTALAAVASGFDPLASLPNGGAGLLGVRPEVVAATGADDALDPKVNVALASSELARLRQLSDDWRAVLALYYSGPSGPDWSDSALDAFVTGVLDTQARLLAEFSPAPAPFAVEQPQPALVQAGRAAYYASGYSVAWWADTLARHASWGNAVPGWAPDPNGYYCVHPDFRPGQRLQLSANGVTLWCTIGDTVNPAHVAQWRASWAVELSWNTFTALHLDAGNWVEVRAP